MKPCRVCGVPLAAGNHSPSQLARREYICRVCKGEKNKQYRRGNPSIIEAANQWRREHPEKAREYKKAGNRRWRSDPANAPKKAAHWKTNNAIKFGRLARPSECPGCGKAGRIQAHHPDYTKPLEVKWLCQRCHTREHRAECV